MVVVGGLPADVALAAIDLHVVVLLFGVLVIAAYLNAAAVLQAGGVAAMLVRAR